MNSRRRIAFPKIGTSRIGFQLMPSKQDLRPAIWAQMSVCVAEILNRACRLGVIHVIPAIPACPVCPESGSWADQAAAVIAAALVADEEHSGGPESVGIVRPHALVRP
jgi:hypothetical protein